MVEAKLFWGMLIVWCVFNLGLLVYSLAKQKFKFKKALGVALVSLFADLFLWLMLAASIASAEQTRALRNEAEEAALEYSPHVDVGELTDSTLLINYPDGDNPQMIYYDGALYIRQVP